MREQEEADRQWLVRRVSTRLVVATHLRDDVTQPRGNRSPVELEQPEPQPAAVERGAGDVTVERRVGEVRLVRAPAGTVQREQRVEVAVERLLVRETEPHLAFPFQLPGPATQLLPEVGAAPGEVRLPTVSGDEQDRTCLPAPGSRPEELGPALFPRQLFADEDLGVHGAESCAECMRDPRFGSAHEHGPELVPWSVADEANDSGQPPPPRVQGENGDESAVHGPARVQQELVSFPEVPPPGVVPLPGGEDPPTAIGESSPLPAKLVERMHTLDARYNFRFRSHGVSSVSAHTSLATRAQRVVAWTVGVPLGSAAVLLLRLTARKAGVALMYHSVAERAGDPTRELVPPHHVRLFERQVRLVRRLYDVVPAERLFDTAAARRRGQRFPVAITFDDDLACHAVLALPVLSELGVTATFFLSGASLERPFAFHYERLQRAFDAGVPDLPALVYGEPARTAARGIHELGLALEQMPPDERDAAAARLGKALGPDPDDAGIRAEQVQALADAGMTIGFHTRRHDSLAWLDDERLERALVDGRSELEAIAGRALTTLGYPHGRADIRVADAARTAGFKAGFTTQHEPVTPESDRLLQGRVGPSLRSAGALAIELALTLVKRGNGQPTPAPEPPAA